MKIKYTFKTKAEAYHYLSERGWVIDHEVRGMGVFKHQLDNAAGRRRIFPIGPTCWKIEWV